MVETILLKGFAPVSGGYRGWKDLRIFFLSFQSCSQGLGADVSENPGSEL